MWVATVDFMKAFDSISHKSLWKALANAVSNHTTSTSWRGYPRHRKGTVLTDKESDKFETKRRTKQGYPLSSLLFNTVLQMALKDDVERWQKPKGMGLRLGDYESDCLTNLRFPDDVLLFSCSLVQLQKVMCDFKQSTESVGLKIQPDKTKILSNQSTNERKEVEINNIIFEILSSCESAKYLYLGQAITFQQTGNSRDQKSNQSGLGIVSGDTNWSWHQDRTSYNTDSAHSTWWSRRRWASPLAFGHYQKNAKE